MSSPIKMNNKDVCSPSSKSGSGIGIGINTFASSSSALTNEILPEIQKENSNELEAGRAFVDLSVIHEEQGQLDAVNNAREPLQKLVPRRHKNLPPLAKKKEKVPWTSEQNDAVKEAYSKNPKVKVAELMQLPLLKDRGKDSVKSKLWTTKTTKGGKKREIEGQKEGSNVLTGSMNTAVTSEKEISENKEISNDKIYDLLIIIKSDIGKMKEDLKEVQEDVKEVKLKLVQ